MKLFRILLVSVVTAASCGAAFAHAVVISASPRAEARIAATELPIEIRFNSRIDAERSNLKLFKADGSATVLPVLDAGSADALKSRATDLSPGQYRLHWQTLSPDGHISQGDIPFPVSPP